MTTQVVPREATPLGEPTGTSPAKLQPWRTGLIAVVGVALLAFLALVSLSIGAREMSLADVARGLLAADDSIPSVVVWQERMPRTFLAIIVGCALAVAGVLMQALTRNPLAEPGLLGVNSGAAFAVVLAMSVWGLTSPSQYLWFAFGGAAAAAGFVYTLSLRRARTNDHARLVLAGAALAACLGSIIGVITMRDSKTFDSYRFWVVGSLSGRTDVIWVVGPSVAIGLVVALLCGPALNVLILGEEQAAALGARLGIVRAAVFFATTVLAGAATAAAGPIGFVGLVVPHALRILLGSDQRKLLALSLVVGPALLLLADIIGRRILPTGEAEAGIVVAFIGAPVLLALLLSRRLT